MTTIVDIKESTQLTKEREPLKLAEVLESSKTQFIRTMQKDIESLQKGQSAKPSMPKADQVKKAAPPTELPVVEPAERPVSPSFSPLSLKSAERLRREAEIKKRIEETQKRLAEERMRAEMARQKTEREKVEEEREKAEEAKPVSPEMPTLPKPIPPKPVSLKKELPLKKEVKPAIKGTRLKFVLIGIGTIVVIAGIGGFLYWWNYWRVIPPVAMYYQCQDFQCVSIEGEGEDQCLTDEDCQPVEPTVPEPLISVDETRTIELTIGQENLLLDDLKLVAAQEQTLNTFKRILAKLVSQTEKKYADLDTFVSALGISLPDSILFTAATSDVEGGNYTLYFYSQLAGNRLAMVIAFAEGVDLSQELRIWEAGIKTDLKAFFLGLDIEAQPAATEEFQDNLYQDIAIRYLNFPAPDLSIDYAVVGNKLVMTTSRESMYASIDALLAAPVDTSDWQTYQNEEYGYEVKYPEGCEISSIGSGECIGIEGTDITKIWPHIEICHPESSIYDPPSGTNLVKWLEDNFEQYEDEEIPDTPNAEIDNTLAIRIYTPGGQAYPSYWIYFIKGDKLFRILLLDVDHEESHQLYDQILSTFKFIEE